MAELNAGDEAFAEAVAEGTPPTESEAPAAEAAVAEVASAETAGEMAEETSDPAADVPASDSDGASQADGVAAPTVKEIIRRVGDLARELEKAEAVRRAYRARSEEHTSELQSLMRTSYAVFRLKKQEN